MRADAVKVFSATDHLQSTHVVELASVGGPWVPLCRGHPVVLNSRVDRRSTSLVTCEDCLAAYAARRLLASEIEDAVAEAVGPFLPSVVRSPRGSDPEDP